jgi:LysM repeat protein
LTDYVSWAYGLKKAGYATDPNYPRKLIAIIDLYELYKYDSKPSSFTDSHQESGRVEQKTIPLPPSQIEQTHLLTGSQREIFSFPLSRKLYSRNGVVFIYSVEEETYASIAQSNRLFLRELLRFNELKNDVPLPAGTIVYLQKKKNQAAEGLEMHVIERGETLRGISQRYGVRLKSLMKINSIKDADMIREGDIIKLRK